MRSVEKNRKSLAERRRGGVESSYHRGIGLPAGHSLPKAAKWVRLPYPALKRKTHPLLKLATDGFFVGRGSGRDITCAKHRGRICRPDNGARDRGFEKRGPSLDPKEGLAAAAASTVSGQSGCPTMPGSQRCPGNAARGIPSTPVQRELGCPGYIDGSGRWRGRRDCTKTDAPERER